MKATTLFSAGEIQPKGMKLLLNMARDRNLIIIFYNSRKNNYSKFFNPCRAHFIQCDVSVKSQVDKMFEEIGEKYGRFDVLFNNAGLAPEQPARLADITEVRPSLRIFQ